METRARAHDRVARSFAVRNPSVVALIAYKTPWPDHFESNKHFHNGKKNRKRMKVERNERQVVKETHPANMSPANGVQLKTWF